MLTVSQLSKSFAGRALFDDVSLQVNRGDRIGLVGPNGAPLICVGPKGTGN
jgi:ATP-binding cassette subfamily F protein 3